MIGRLFSRAPSGNASTKEIGDREESRALDYFKRQGWKLLDRNYSCRMGEIDLIFTDPQDSIVFVEVKYRSSSRFGQGQEAVGSRKQDRILKTALRFIKERRLEGRGFRFDVLALTPGEIEHIPDAFESGRYSL